MKNCRLCAIIVFCVLPGMAISQSKSTLSFRVGPAISFALSNIANNDAGIGGVAGIEKRFNKTLAVEAEGSYTYFIGDKVQYLDGKNKSFTIPVLVGAKLYATPNLYGSARLGAIYFLLNQISVAQMRLAWGLAGGLNFPEKSNRINLQLGYTGFHYGNVQHGYATLAVAIIIN